MLRDQPEKGVNLYDRKLFLKRLLNLKSPNLYFYERFQIKEVTTPLPRYHKHVSEVVCYSRKMKNIFYLHLMVTFTVLFDDTYFCLKLFEAEQVYCPEFFLSVVIFVSLDVDICLLL